MFSAALVGWLWLVFFAHASVQFSAGQNVDFLVSSLTANTAVAQGDFEFTETGSFLGVLVPVKKIGTPTGDLLLTIYEGGADPDVGTIVASSTMSQADVPTTYEALVGSAFVFNAPLTVASTSTSYWLVFSATVIDSDTNVYKVGADNTQPLAGQQVKDKTAGVWLGDNLDIGFTFFNSFFDLVITEDNGITINTSSTATSTEFNCEDQGLLCNLIAYLFVPSQASMDRFGNLVATFEHKPPFGYLTSFSDAVSGLSSTSTTSTLDLSPLSGAVSVFAPLKTMQAWLFWFLFGFWAYNKFRHMKF